MSNNIELFDSYISGSLDTKDTEMFKKRLGQDKDFREEFMLYLITVKALISETEQDNLEFARSVISLTDNQFEKAIGKRKTKSHGPRIRKRSFMRERMYWASGLAAAILLAVVTIGYIRLSDSQRVDNMIVAYNESSYPYVSRGAMDEDSYLQTPVGNKAEDSFQINVEALRAEYNRIPVEDAQYKKMIGKQLAIEYIRQHDRKNARIVLEQLLSLYGSDETFSADCRRILNQIE